MSSIGSIQSFRMIRLSRAVLLCIVLWAAWVSSGEAVELVNDPKGYRGFRWGQPLAGSKGLKETKTVDHVSEFELTPQQVSLGDAPVDSIRLFAYDRQFARVTIRYHGRPTHKRILVYLQAQYGPLDSTPLATTSGINQQLTWLGPETEITDLYDGVHDRGYVFIESRLLAAKFYEGMSETAE